MSKIIQDQMIKKAKAGELHNVYLLNYSNSEIAGELTQWTMELLTNYLKLNDIQTSIENQQDILILSADDKKKFYGTESLEQIFKFLNYKSVELPRKFLVLTDVGRLSESDSNKLLKTFEEPPIPLTIFLLNPRLAHILPTVSSRCIKITLKSEQMQTEPIELPWPMNFSEFSAKISSGERLVPNIVASIFAKVEEGNLRPERFNRIKKHLESLDRDLLYNGPLQGRAFRLYSCLEELANS